MEALKKLIGDELREMDEIVCGVSWQRRPVHQRATPLRAMPAKSLPWLVRRWCHDVCDIGLLCIHISMVAEVCLKYNASGRFVQGHMTGVQDAAV